MGLLCLICLHVIFKKVNQRVKTLNSGDGPKCLWGRPQPTTLLSFFFFSFSVTGNPKSPSLWQMQPINSSGRKRPIWGNLYNTCSRTKVIRVCFMPCLYCCKILNFGNQHKQNNLVDHCSRIKMRIRTGNSLVELKYLWLIISYKDNSREHGEIISHQSLYNSSLFPLSSGPAPFPLVSQLSFF